MVSENRIKATLDQKERIIEFEVEGQAINNYNSQILNVCTNLNSLIIDILKKHPELQKYDTHMSELIIIGANFCSFGLILMINLSN